MAKTPPSLPCKVLWKDLLAQRTRDPKQFYFIAVRWEDAIHSPSEQHGTVEALSAGILYQMDRKAISLSLDAYADAGRTEVSTIPRKMVRHIILFSVIPPFEVPASDES